MELETMAVNINAADNLELIKMAREPRYKRPFDLLVLVSALVLLAPIWLVLWIVIPLAIKLDDRGPVFYSQRRIGRGGKVFTVRKFRSMVIDAERGTGAVWATRNDPRITRVGRVLRHTALDELPQIVNIWTGDMSLVGPRPERPELHERFAAQIAEFDLRLQVRPGMAGMAQIYGEYDLSPPQKLAHDLRYIRSMTLFLDLKLLILAVMNTMLGRWGHAKRVTRAASPGTASPSKTVPDNVVPFTPAPDAAPRHVADDASVDRDEEEQRKAA